MSNETNNVKETIKKAYIEGIHRQQDKELALTGFHPDFIMFVLSQDNSVAKVSLDTWFQRILTAKDEDPKVWEKEVTFKFHEVTIHSSTAFAKLSILKDGKYFATDMMLLYNIENKWKIASKIFSTNEKPQEN
jgi:hypothetical protein